MDQYLLFVQEKQQKSYMLNSAKISSKLDCVRYYHSIGNMVNSEKKFTIFPMLWILQVQLEFKLKSPTNQLCFKSI